MSSTTCTCPLPSRRWSNDAGICETCGLPTEPPLEIDPVDAAAIERAHYGDGSGEARSVVTVIAGGGAGGIACATKSFPASDVGASEPVVAGGSMPEVDPTPADRCLCRAWFRTAEDFRDHLPCPAVPAAAHPFAFTDAAIDSYIARILSSNPELVPPFAVSSRRGVMRAILAEVLRGECPPVAVLAVVDPPAASPSPVEMVMGPQVQTREGEPGGRVVARDGAVRVVHDDAALARVMADIGTGVDLVDAMKAHGLLPYDAVDVDIDGLGSQPISDEELLELVHADANARTGPDYLPMDAAMQSDDEVAAEHGQGDGIFAPDASELNAEMRALDQRVGKIEKSFGDLMTSWNRGEIPPSWKEWIAGEIQRHANRMHERMAVIDAKATAATAAPAPVAAAPARMVAEALHTLLLGLTDRALTPGAREHFLAVVQQIWKGN